MTKITFTKKDNEYTVIALDHAHGSDAVCAGISALLYALEGYLNNCWDVSDHTSVFKNGYVSINFKGGQNANAAFEMAMIGMLQIEAGYPDYISVICNG